MPQTSRLTDLMTGCDLGICPAGKHSLTLPIAENRIRVIHLKDGIAAKPECRNYEHCHDGVEGKSVGSGEAPILAIRDWCLKNDVLMVIESEGLDPTGPEEVKRCIDYLRTLD